MLPTADIQWALSMFVGPEAARGYTLSARGARRLLHFLRQMLQYPTCYRSARDVMRLQRVIADLTALTHAPQQAADEASFEPVEGGIFHMDM